jgi:hypothetical protein
MEKAGQDKTEAFEGPIFVSGLNFPLNLDVGHSTDARQMMKDYLIGEVVDVRY